MERLALIIPAAGSGTRMNSDAPKPFLNIAGKPILELTLQAFSGIENLSQVIIASGAAYRIQVLELLQHTFPETIASVFVEGGAERQHSIANAIEILNDSINLVAVHDAVRPFVSQKEIESCCIMAKKHGGAVLGVKSRNTIKMVDSNNKITSTPDRNFLWQANTPQVFQKELLVKAYAKAKEDEFTGTDDASLVERIGGQVVMVEGSQQNIKITFPEDLKMAELMLQERQ